MGPTRVGEWLMVDVRVAKAIAPDSRLFAICRDLVTRGHCGIVEATLVIDLLEMSTDDRRYLLRSPLGELADTREDLRCADGP